MSIVDTICKRLTSAPPEIVREVLDFLDFLESRPKSGRDQEPQSFRRFFGALKDSPELKGDPVEIQRRLRAEWGR